MKYPIPYLLLLLLFSKVIDTSAQHLKRADELLAQRGEIYIKFQKQAETNLQELGKAMSIDKVEKHTGSSEIYAYLNRKQFEEFKNINPEFELLTPPSMMADVAMCPDLASVKKWDCYPTYNQYVSLMESYQTAFPNLCELHEFGQSTYGRKLLALKISDNVAEKEEEPGFFYTSTIHGDETTGFILMLRLIDYLLTNYVADNRITDMLINTEIWINPLSNPDGTYAAGNSTINGASRFNSNYVDLNRNFPDPRDGQHPDNEDWQPETIAMMDFLKQHHFTLSANFHGGAEVVNYPWDTWTSLENKHADDDWYQEISHEYADTVHANSTNYMNTLDGNPNPSGITNGGDWYVITGGRQDYMNYFMHSREVTIEISKTKMPVPATLTNYWNYNYRSMLNYINRVHTGIFGKVTDQYGAPISANLFLNGYDMLHSDIYSDSISGMYYRMLPSGTYHLTASKTGYYSSEFDIVAPSSSKIEQNIVLQKYPEGIEPIEMFYKISNPFSNELTINLELSVPGEVEIKLHDLNGRQVVLCTYSGTYGINRINIATDGIINGIYLCTIRSDKIEIKKKLIKLGSK